MEFVELLTVEASFEIPSRGVVLIPDFPIPEGWTDRVEHALVVTPDGERIDTTAQFCMTHFHLSDPAAPLEAHWRVVVVLPDWKTGRRLTDAKLLVSRATRDALVGAIEA